MGPSKRKSRQMSDEPEEPEEPYYSVRGILDENKTKYLVDWEDIGSTKYPPSWEPKNFVTGEAIQEWEEEKKQKQLAEERKKKRKSTTARELVQLDNDDDEEPGSEKRHATTNTASGSGSKSKPSLKLSFGKQKPVVEIDTPTAKVSEPLKRKPGRPRKSEVSIVQPEEDEDAPPLAKRGRGRPRKSNPVIEVDPKEKEQDDDDEDSEHQSVKLHLGKIAKPGPSTGLKRKRNVNSSEVVDISSDDDSDVPIRTQMKRRRMVVPDSSEEAQLARKEVHRVATPKKRGRPRKYPIPGSVAPIPVTPVVTVSVGTTEIEDSEIFDAAAAQLQREVRSARKRSPSPRQSPVRQPSPEFDEGVSDFRSSQIVRGTQPELPRAEEQTVMEELTDSQSMIDAAAASSLSAKNSLYEPSGSSFNNTKFNSSSGVHTIPNLLIRRFGPDAVISDSQSYLDGSSVHISEQRTQAEQPTDDQMENIEDATTESQIVVELGVVEQMVIQDLPVPESSIAQKPEDAPQPNVAAPATESEPPLELTTRKDTGGEAASSPVAPGIIHHVSTRSPSPASLGAARSSSTSSAPPTEAADKSTQSQSELQSQPQNQSSSDLPSQNEAPVERLPSPSRSAVINQESGQNTVSVQPQVTQQSHVEQAAQQVSFQQPPTQQRPTLDFVQSSAEEGTPSSLGFNTQIAPAQRVLAVSIPSSPVASLPSNLPNTIGDSAPSPIRSLSDLSRQHTPSANMTLELNPDGTPKRVPFGTRVREMRATNQARRDAEAREEAIAAERAAAERAAAARAVISTPSRVAAPVLDMHSPKPASAVPARLMSPAITDREARSPSTVPPVEEPPEETAQNNGESERYETLLPGQGPQINTETSRPYVSQDLTMLDIDTDSDNQHLVSLEFQPLQRDHYKCSFDTYKAFVEKFTLHGILPASSQLAKDARDFIRQLHYIVNHVDLNNADTSASSQTTQSLQADWDATMSSKFKFMKSLLDSAKGHNLHVALLVDPGRLAAILQSFLQGINIMYNVIDGQNNVINQESTATIILTSVDSIDTTSLDMDLIVAIDGTTPKDVITRTQKMFSRDTLVPTISLVIPLSIEHAEHCLPSTGMSEAQRLHVLVSTVTNERLNAGWQSGGTDTDFERKASDIVSWMLNPAEADWTFYGLPSLQLIEGRGQSSEDELMVDNSSSNKRSLEQDNDNEVTLAKRLRVDESLPLTINAADMHLAPGTIPTNSHVSDSVAASQHAATLIELNNARVQIRELNQAMERLQFNCEEQRAQMVKAQKERNEAVQREERLSASNIDLRAKNFSLRDDVLDLKKQLEVANAALLNHSVPERAEIEKSKSEALAAVTETEGQVKRTKMLEEQLDYLRSQYQDRSNENTVLAAANADYAKKVEELEVKASGERARLKAINNDALIKKYQDTVKQLRTVVKEREGTMQRMSEENARLREPRGRVGTRASSIPRSPRAGTREPVSRQGSPSVQRPHPLRKEN
ncbi:hypothetical protein E4T52_14062 [Aureobasidium sp. EXF-3400]|nr:hypothetical protein E4T51_01179 [Aureobasidium sp. EXF-12344]KAI4770930.1 hypothetical protein E4T52_14062 [Aureobasidium sp. EXF-3400]